MSFIAKSIDLKNAVQFKGIGNAYPIDTSITVQYVFVGGYIPNSSDWVGLFKEGWSSQRDYVTYMYAQLPTNKAESSSVDFQKRYLPEEDGNSYQFCYISSDKNILGVSSLFKFVGELIEDLEELRIDGDSFVKSECNLEYNNAVEALASQNKIDKLLNQVNIYHYKCAELENKTIMMSIENRLNKSKISEEILQKNEKISGLEAFSKGLITDIGHMEHTMEHLRQKIKSTEATLSREIKSHKNTALELQLQLKSQYEAQRMQKKLSKQFPYAFNYI